MERSAGRARNNERSEVSFICWTARRCSKGKSWVVQLVEVVVVLFESSDLGGSRGYGREDLLMLGWVVMGWEFPRSWAGAKLEGTGRKLERTKRTFPTKF